jgi:diguanylate cyclase (GGDEF)-like protein
MNQLSSHARIPFMAKRSVLFKDVIIALCWAILVGIPLFVVHMILFDFEHGQHTGSSYSFVQSITNTIPQHPASLSLWLLAIFIAAFAIRRTFKQQIMLTRAQDKLALSHTLALTDGLTGIWNRAGFEELQEIVMARALKENRPFSIILGDVDGLKRYNDTYGHPQADIALKEVTQILSAQIRTSDAIARYGGDEFAIFCFDLDRDGAECLVGRLTSALQNSPLSMSFGIASFPIDVKNSKTLIETADSRLYQAKAESHNFDNSHHRNFDCQCEDCKCGNEDGYVKPLAADL